MLQDSAPSELTKTIASVKLITTPQELAQAHAIRMEVFVGEQECCDKEEVDAIDSQCTHWLISVQEGNSVKSVGTLRLVPYSETKMKLGRCCILKAYRKKGYGKLMVEALEAHVAGLNGVKSVDIHAQTDSRGFYESTGYVCTSEDIFYEENIPHVLMSKTFH